MTRDDRFLSALLVAPAMASARTVKTAEESPVSDPLVQPGSHVQAAGGRDMNYFSTTLSFLF
jgi:hypothetical protein